METTKTFRNLKVGDTVFVVHQRRRGQTEERSEHMQVIRIGRKYAYVEKHNREEVFCLDTGNSVHKDDTTRANGYGFDVYLCEDDYRTMQRDSTEFSRLQNRLLHPVHSYRIIDLSPMIVTAIHEILDKFGIAKDGH